MTTYIVVIVFCLIILAVVSLKTVSPDFEIKGQPLVLSVLMMAMIIGVSDILSIVLNGNDGLVSVIGNYVFSIIYLIGSVIISYLWFLFSLSSSPAKIKNIKLISFLFSLPVLVFSGLAISSPFTGYVFTITDNGAYKRGPFIYMQLILIFAYMLVGSFYILYQAKKTNNLFIRKEAYVFSTFPLYPAIGMLLQFFYPETPLGIMGLTLGLFMNFITIFEYHMSLDTLTGLNNRLKLKKYYDARLKHPRLQKNTYLVFIDIDDFKRINDEKGHTEGDQALIRLSQALVKSVSRRSFVSRYGGDEFVLICQVGNGKSISQIMNKITKNANLDPGKEKINFSYGSLSLEDNPLPFEEAIMITDKLLYEDKKKKADN